MSDAAQPSSFSPGARLAQYQIVRPIGAGGMGIVYLAQDIDLDRPVALKLLRLPALTSDTPTLDPRAADRFLREARSAAKLNHPNVAAIYQIGRHESLTFIAMEWLDGGNLADHLKRSIFLEWAESTRAIRDAAAGLAAAHAAGIIHRDIKPTNLMRTAAGDVKLVDFGLARQHDAPSDLTHTGSILGTPAYLSPEQCKGQPATPLSDLYALACTYFHLLTSRPPFTSPDLPGLLYQHAHEPFPDPRRFADDIPEAACQILAKAAAKNPADRYPSAAAMLADLEAVLAGRAPASIETVATNASAAAPNNLPHEITSFVGRDSEIAQTKHLLSHSRIVTLIGPGGTGKTRLALQTARQLQGNFPDGLWLIDLAPLQASDDPARALAAVLNLRQAPGQPLIDQIAAHLQAKRALLLIDNCEHMIDAVAQLAAALSTRVSELHILATSRQPLGCPGESVMRVPSLPLPDFDDAASPTELQRVASIQLFTDRAAAARANFALDAANAPAIAQICRRLDGIPLAIELAAARIKVLSVQQIAARLDDAFKLLTSGAKTLLPRQQTLRALIDWSYDLLDPAERIALARLSVFAGGASLEAAEKVLPDDSLHSDQVLDLIAGLVDKSLIQAEERDGQIRYRMLQTIQQYAAEKLAATDAPQSVHHRHAQYFADFAQSAAAGFDSPGQSAATHLLDIEHENLQLALATSIDSSDLHTALRLGAAMGPYWFSQGQLALGLSSLQRLTSLPQPDSALLAECLDHAGLLALYFGQQDVALQCFERAHRVAREQNAHKVLASALNHLGSVCKQSGDLARAMEYFQQALELRRQIGDRNGQAAALNNLGLTANGLGQAGLARQYLEQSLEIYHEIKNIRGVAYAYLNLGEFEYEQDRPAAAKPFYERSLSQLTEMSDQWGQSYAQDGLGKCALAQGDFATARHHFQQTLDLARKLGDKSTIADLLDQLAQICVYQDLPDDSAHAFAGESLQIRTQINDRVGVAASLETQAALLAAQDPSQSANLLGRAARIREALAAPIPKSRQQVQSQTIANLTSRLGEAQFNLQFDQGKQQEKCPN